MKMLTRRCFRLDWDELPARYQEDFNHVAVGLSQVLEELNVKNENLFVLGPSSNQVASRLFQLRRAKLAGEDDHDKGVSASIVIIDRVRQPFDLQTLYLLS
jgi:hypothetical protein